MIYGQEEKPSLEDALEHYGVKGMHWGVRKKRDSGGGEPKADSHSSQIKDARIKLQSRTNEINRTTDRLNIASAKGSGASDKQIQALVKQYHKQVAAYDNDPARALAVRLTTGEKVASILLLGPVAAVPIGGSALISRSITKSQAKKSKG